MRHGHGFGQIHRRAIFRLFQAKPGQQFLKPLAVFGQINGVGRRAQNGDIGRFQRRSQFQRRLPAQLHDHPMQGAIALFHRNQLQYIFSRQWFKIQPVAGVIIGRDGFGVAIDHDGFIAHIRKRKGRMAAAIVKLDPLADAVGPAPQNNNLARIGWGCFTIRHAGGNGGAFIG